MERDDREVCRAVPLLPILGLDAGNPFAATGNVVGNARASVSSLTSGVALSVLAAERVAHRTDKLSGIPGIARDRSGSVGVVCQTLIMISNYSNGRASASRRGVSV